MCIVLLDWQPGSALPLAVAANRDEFHGREAEPARWRGDVFCGLDKQAGGTWLGIHRDGRFAVVTNFREPIAERTAGDWSRGRLPQAFLESRQSPEGFCREMQQQQQHYAGFNLLVGDRDQLWYLGNRGAPPRPVTPGRHGLSNGLLDDAWPKVERGKRRLGDSLRQGADLHALLAVVNDRHQPDDSELPDTGVPGELERLVAPIFIRSHSYGTRASSAVLLPARGEPRMAEQNWRPDGQPQGPVRESRKSEVES